MGKIGDKGGGGKIRPIERRKKTILLRCLRIATGPREVIRDLVVRRKTRTQSRGT